MKNESGMTLVELVVVLALGVVLLATSAAYAIPMIAREAMRSAVYDVQTHMQLARIEAVKRNRDCRVLINSTERSVAVIDTAGTVTSSDDEVLYQTSLPGTVSFARPDSGSALTLEHVSGAWYASVFQADGTVKSGSGEVFLFGGDSYRRLSLYAAGGVEVERWNGSSWITGG